MCIYLYDTHGIFFFYFISSSHIPAKWLFQHLSILNKVELLVRLEISRISLNSVMISLVSFLCPLLCLQGILAVFNSTPPPQEKGYLRPPLWIHLSFSLKVQSPLDKIENYLLSNRGTDDFKLLGKLQVYRIYRTVLVSIILLH